MRQLSHLFALFFLLFHLSTSAQSDIPQDRRVDPILKQVHAKQPGLRIFSRKDGKGGYVNMAVLNENSRKLTWFTCYGLAFDSLQLQTNAYEQIITKSVDPFTFYRNYCYNNLSYIEQAEIQYRINGRVALEDSSHNSQVVYHSTPVRSAKSTLQKLVAIEGLMRRVCLQLRLFDCRAPRQLVYDKNDSIRVRQDMAGIMIQKADTTEYYNTDLLSKAAKIVLYKHSPDKLIVFNQEGTVFDSVPLKQDKYASLLKEKEDVFLLYRGWKELQWQQVVDEKRQYEALSRRLDSSLYRSVSWEQSRRELQNIAVSLQERQIAIDNKISSLIVPEEKYIERLVADFYRNETSEISYLQGLGFAYTTTYVRGSKSYELSDHRGNVMAVMSDKKRGSDVNSDGTIDYYNADIVSANDYYPFGMLQPGRTYSADDKYRYGYNGKENDNEVMGEGNQQDYGMRIYDPRLGRFLSVDPLTKDFAYYSPYQFAGNNPIYNVDLDGKEPKSFMWELKKLSEGHTKWNYTVSTVVDPINNQVYTIMHYPNSDSYYSWKNNDGSDGVFTGDNVQDGKWTGYWQGYTLPEVKYAKTLGDLSTGLGAGFAGMMAIGAAAPLLLELAPALGIAGDAAGAQAWRLTNTATKLAWKGANWLGREYGKDLLIETGKEFLANRGDVSKMDWFDVATSTVASKFNLGFAGQLMVEGINASTDISLGDGVQTVVGSGANKKSYFTAGFDLMFGALQVKLNDGFQKAGQNIITETVSDVMVDQIKFEIGNDQMVQ